MTTDDDPADLEPTITERDTTPRPRQTESQLAHERRMADMKLSFLGPEQSVITPSQIDDIVKRVSEHVTSAVLAAIRKETRDNVRADMAEAFKQLGFLSGRVLS